MATVRTNPIVNNLSGMLGNTIVFKTLRGKTIMANRPSPPQKQSEQQKTNRSKFRDASHWAHKILLDPDKKAYYQKKAKKLKLPNAYTAAITDYMRKPKLDVLHNHNTSITCAVGKKDFQLKKVEVIVSKEHGSEVRTVTASGSEWFLKLMKEELEITNISVTDEAGNVFVITGVSVIGAFG